MLIEIDAAEMFSSEMLEAYVGRMFAAGKRNIAVDVAALDYIYSDALNLLTRLNAAAGGMGGCVAVLSPQPKIAEIIRNAGIHATITMFNSEADLLAGSGWLKGAQPIMRADAAPAAAMSANQTAALNAMNAVAAQQQQQYQQQQYQQQQQPQQQPPPQQRKTAQQKAVAPAQAPAAAPAPLVPPVPKTPDAFWGSRGPGAKNTRGGRGRNSDWDDDDDTRKKKKVKAPKPPKEKQYREKRGVSLFRILFFLCIIIIGAGAGLFFLNPDANREMRKIAVPAMRAAQTAINNVVAQIRQLEIFAPREEPVNIFATPPGVPSNIVEEDDGGEGAAADEDGGEGGDDGGGGGGGDDAG